MNNRENVLQRKCLKWLGEHHKEDVLPANIHGGGWSSKGFPDVICCVRGLYVAFELKVKNNTLSGDQIVWKNRILRVGGLHYSPYTFEEFKANIEEAISIAERVNNAKL